MGSEHGEIDEQRQLLEADLRIWKHFLKYEEVFCSKHKTVEIGISNINNAHRTQDTRRCCNESLYVLTC